MFWWQGGRREGYQVGLLEGQIHCGGLVLYLIKFGLVVATAGSGRALVEGLSGLGI